MAGVLSVCTAMSVFLFVWPSTTGFPTASKVAPQWARFEAEVIPLGRASEELTMVLARPLPSGAKEAELKWSAVLAIEHEPYIHETLSHRRRKIRVELSARTLRGEAAKALRARASRALRHDKSLLEKTEASPLIAMEAVSLGFEYFRNGLFLLIASIAVLLYMGREGMEELQGRRLVPVSSSRFRHVLEFGGLLVCVSFALVGDGLARRLGARPPWPLPFGSLCVIGAPLVVLFFKLVLPRLTRLVGIGR